MAERDSDHAAAATGLPSAPLPAPLGPDVLRRTTDPESLPDDLGSIADGLIGQDRALRAIAFGTEIEREGFNLFVMGAPGSGRHSAVRSLLEARAKDEPAPEDWVYVYNFETPHQPRALRLPVGQATRLRDAMDALVADLGEAIPALFDSDDYKSRRGAIEQDLEEAQESAFSALNDKAREKNVSIMRTPAGFAFAPQHNGEVVKPEVFQALEESERERIQADIAELQADLKQILERMPALEKDRRDRVRALNKEMATGLVRVAIADVAKAFAEIDVVTRFLEKVQDDVVANVEIFVETAMAAQNAPMPVTTALATRDPRLRRYSVNVIVGACDEDTGCAPVVHEPNPTFRNLIGRIEHTSQMGALVTDFTLIKPGALHRANGGYLILDARQLLTQPGAWEGLKRAMRTGEARINGLAEQMGLVSTISLEPDPIPLSVKIALIGDRMLYYLLHAHDPDFSELFKVEADFNDTIDRGEASNTSYAALIASIAARENLRPVTKPGLARMIDAAARLAADAEKLSLRVGVVADILREADHWAGKDSANEIDDGHVQQAVSERRERAGRVRERVHESITRDIVLIDTSGAAVGQINGLSVLSLGDQAFGTPTRITARTRMGTGKVVDIEREVDLGGPLHSKGVLILSGYLSTRYALDAPASLWASLVFEQSYGGVDGDSASSAELYALLSALSGVPIKQSFAVTGSVNQFGQVQAIGGVNEKIEGFFDICAARGLTGDQGVLIPVSNVKHLMLREDVVEACANGKFAVHAVTEIDQGIEILTGVTAGARDADSRYPEGSINARVEAALLDFAAARRQFAGKDDSAGKTA